MINDNLDQIEQNQPQVFVGNAEQFHTWWEEQDDKAYVLSQKQHLVQINSNSCGKRIEIIPARTDTLWLLLLPTDDQCEPALVNQFAFDVSNPEDVYRVLARTMKQLLPEATEIRPYDPYYCIYNLFNFEVNANYTQIFIEASFREAVRRHRKQDVSRLAIESLKLILDKVFERVLEYVERHELELEGTRMQIERAFMPPSPHGPQFSRKQSDAFGEMLNRMVREEKRLRTTFNCAVDLSQQNPTKLARVVSQSSGQYRMVLGMKCLKLNKITVFERGRDQELLTLSATKTKTRCTAEGLASINNWMEALIQLI